MNKLVFGNSDYIPRPGGGHMTDEGHQLQEGLRHSGWKLAGRRLEIDEVSVPAIMERERPDAVFFQDVRDWDAESRGCFDKSIGFVGVERIIDYPAFRCTVVKDAGTSSDFQRQFFERIAAQAAVIYYHPQSVLPLSPWLANTTLIRTWHSINSKLVYRIPFPEDRQNGVVTGAVSGVYPLRRMAVEQSANLGLFVLGHPGYHNRGCRVEDYLRVLSRFKVHVATASRFGFALRKIIESVCMGCTVVTDLPAYDVLPEIDECLVRVKPDISPIELREVIARAAADWDEDRARRYAELAVTRFDFRRTGSDLSTEILQHANQCHHHLC